MSAALFIGTSYQPALAYNRTCTIPFFWTTCTTSWVSANSSGHFVWIQVNNCDSGWFRADTRWKIDTGNGYLGTRGSVSPGHYMKKKVRGLYGTYRLRLDGDPFSFGNIHNDDIGWREGTWSC